MPAICNAYLLPHFQWVHHFEKGVMKYQISIYQYIFHRYIILNTSLQLLNIFKA